MKSHHRPKVYYPSGCNLHGNKMYGSGHSEGVEYERVPTKHEVENAKQYIISDKNFKVPPPKNV